MPLRLPPAFAVRQGCGRGQFDLVWCRPLALCHHAPFPQCLGPSALPPVCLRCYCPVCRRLVFVVGGGGGCRLRFSSLRLPFTVRMLPVAGVAAGCAAVRGGPVTSPCLMALGSAAPVTSIRPFGVRLVRRFGYIVTVVPVVSPPGSSCSTCHTFGRVVALRLAARSCFTRGWEAAAMTVPTHLWDVHQLLFWPWGWTAGPT